MKLIKLFVAVSALFYACCEASQCYYPDSSNATDWNYVACTNDTYSACCIQEGKEHDVCLPDGLCWFSAPQNHGSYVFRGACTDESFTRPECSIYCTTDIGNTWESLIWCNATQNFCCARAAKDQSDTDCCDHEQYRFGLPNIPSWLTQTLIDEASQRPLNATSPGLTSPSTDPTAATSATSATDSATPTPSHAGSKTNHALVGGLVGLGVIIFFICIGVGVLFGYCIYRRKTPRGANSAVFEKNAATPPTANGAAGSTGGTQLRTGDRTMSIPAIAPEATDVGPPFEFSADERRIVDPPYVLPVSPSSAVREREDSFARISSIASGQAESSAESSSRGMRRAPSNTPSGVPLTRAQSF